MVKPAAKALLKFAGLPVARSVEFQAGCKPSAGALGALFPNGCVIKPADKGSSVGLSVARDSDGAEKALSGIESGSWMAEELVKGREFSIGVICGRAAGVVEIIPDGGVYDYKRKYTAGSTRYVYPGRNSAARGLRNARGGGIGLPRVRLPRLRARGFHCGGYREAGFRHTRNKHPPGNDPYEPPAQKRFVRRV